MKMKNSMLVALALLPTLGFAADEVKPAEVQQMAKADWLAQIKKIVPEPICQGFTEDESISKRLKEKGISKENCLKEIPSLTDYCINQYNDKMPDMMTQENAGTWGRTIGECIGMQYAKKFLYPELNTPDVKAAAPGAVAPATPVAPAVAPVPAVAPAPAPAVAPAPAPAVEGSKAP